MKKLIAIALALLPTLVSAQRLDDINNVALKATNIGNLVVQIAISLAVIWIIVNIVRYLVIGGSDEEARKKGGQSILFGVVGLFVILSIWGLVYLLRNSFQFSRNTAPQNSEIKLPPPPVVPN